MLSELPGGYHFMVMGADISPPIAEEQSHSHFFQLGSLHDEFCKARANFDELPLPSECVDTVVLHHALEFSANPHRVLNEVTRVILPSGHLLVICFNPWSVYGIYSSIMRLLSNKPRWRRHILRKRRLLDWLKLLHMQPISCCTAGYPLPKWCRERWGNKSWFIKFSHNHFLPFGGSQLILARKVVSRPLRAGKPAWRVLPVAHPNKIKTSVTHSKGTSVERS